LNSLEVEERQFNAEVREGVKVDLLEPFWQRPEDSLSQVYGTIMS
jgi:hypothetical protein